MTRTHPRRARAVLPTAVAMVALWAGGAGAAPFQLATAPEGGPRAVFTFEAGPAPGGARLDTERAGVAGSRVTVRIDRSPTPVLSRLLTAQDCRFEEGAASRCALALDADDPTYAVLVESFRLGRTAHVEVETGGVMDMDHSVSLVGFARALGR